MSLEKEEIPIMIWLYITCNWLHKLKYEYKALYKNIFVDRYEQLNIIGDQKNFI